MSLVSKVGRITDALEGLISYPQIHEAIVMRDSISGLEQSIFAMIKHALLYTEKNIEPL